MTKGPFGIPAFISTPHVSVLALAECRSPQAFFAKVRAAARGAVLMESADQSARSGIKSLVIPAGLVRLTLRGERGVYRALSVRSGRLLDALAARLPSARRGSETLEADFPEAIKDPATADDDRLRSPSVLDGVRALTSLVADEASTVLAPGVYGAFSYEIVDRFEVLPTRKPDAVGDADAELVLAADAIVYDHIQETVQIITRSLDDSEEERQASQARHARYLAALASGGRDHALAPQVERVRLEKAVETDVSDAQFRASVERFLEHIRAGDIFQGVLSRGLHMKSAAESLDVYRELRRENPSPYMFHLDLEDGALLGASPETCIKVEDGEVEIRPIAGTAPRGLDGEGRVDIELDTRLAVGLLLDRKEQAEHAMLVDLARNDVARVSASGTRRVEEPLSIEKYSHVQHLVSRVCGRLRADLDALHAYRASANMGTLTGAPKLRAMELIREEEPFSRGYYGGAVGYLLQDGSFDSCIVIRSLRYHNGRYLCRAGAGIVADSVPERELEETEHKARACRVAVAAAEGSRS